MDTQNEHLAQAIARGERERPEIERNTAAIIEAIDIAAKERPKMGGKFVAYTTVEAHDSLRPDEPVTGRAIADIVIATWDDVVAADRDEMASAGI